VTKEIQRRVHAAETVESGWLQKIRNEELNIKIGPRETLL
jgi:hypothetical protein